MNKEHFIMNSNRAKAVHSIYLNENIGLGHIILLSEIVVRKLNEKPLPNVKWLQTELQISFTKVKTIVESLEDRGFIMKTHSQIDHRVKLINITDEGEKYIYKLTESLPYE